MFHKILNTQKGFLREKTHIRNSYLFNTSVPLYVQSFQPFLWKNRGNHWGSGGCRYGSQLSHHWLKYHHDTFVSDEEVENRHNLNDTQWYYHGRKVLCAITSIKMFKHFSPFIKYLGTKGAGEVGIIQGRVRSLQEQHSIQFAKMQLIGPMLWKRKISASKAWPTEHIYLNKEH